MALTEGLLIKLIGKHLEENDRYLKEELPTIPAFLYA
jgi:hypothetical protein